MSNFGSDEPFNHEMDERIKKLGQQIGPTRKFPEGKIHKSDEGEIGIGITAQKGKVILEFGTNIHWIGFPPILARDLAKSLEKFALEAELQEKIKQLEDNK